MKLTVVQRMKSNSGDILERVDMVQLLLDIGFTGVDPDSEEQMLFCVFHDNSNTPAFSVNTAKKVFHCFNTSCGVSGSAITLYALWKQITYEQARNEIQYLPRRRSIELIQQQLSQMKPVMPVTERLSILTKFTEAMPLLSSTPLASRLTSRGITKETMDRFRLRAYDEQVSTQFDQEKLFYAGISNVWRRPVFGAHPILFPFYVGSSVAFIQGRLADDNPTKSKYLGCRGTVPCVFNHDALSNRPERVFITEGVIDALSLEQMGYGPALGIVGTEGFKTEWVENFKDVRQVWLAVDNDPAGDAAASNLAPIFAAHGREVFRLGFDRAYKDINEVLVKVGSL